MKPMRPITVAAIWLFALGSLALFGWYRAARKVPLPKVAIEDIAPPPSASVTLIRSMNLNSISALAYGSERLSVLLQTHNHIADVTRIPDGTMIQTPCLPRMFQQAGLDPRFQPAINVLCKTWQDFHARALDYRTLPSSVSSSRSAGVLLPPILRAEFERLARAVDLAAASITEEVQSPRSKPLEALFHFQQAAEALRALANGTANQDYGTEMVYQRLAIGLSYVLNWAQTSRP
jgi:hypothetical protein